MAQTLQHQDRENSDCNDKSSNQQLPVSRDKETGQDNSFKTAAGQVDTSIPQEISPAFTAAESATQIKSSSPAQGTNQDNQHLFVFNRHQPSKVFITKCRSELESLLTSIKDKYHEEIKSLNNNEGLYADLFVQIGEEFKKPLHKCILVARAFRLYSALKAFELVEVPVEEDIIVSEFQSKVPDKPITEESESDEINGSRPQSPQTEGDKVDLSTVHCHLPDDLISPELLLNFVRRVYLDQDVSEEEIQLHQRLIDWLKVNKPELIKVPPKHSPDHRESFRTVQPFFEESVQVKSAQMMSADQSSHNLVDEVEINVDDLGGNSQAASMKEESLTSSLTRTETFELITKNNPGSPSSTSTPNRDTIIDSNDEDRGTDNNSELSATDNSVPYAPTTRAGLKPKIFTTPSNMRAAPRSSPSSVSTKTVPNQISKVKETSKTTSQTSPRVQPTKPTNAPTAAKRSSLSSKNQPDNESIITSPQIKSNSANKNSTTAAMIGKAKLTSIARAHPISMERSQSPNSNIVKSSGKNFIAANKRLVSQMEKKVVQPDTSILDPETENSDTNSLVYEPLTTDNLAAHMDKFTLVSYSKLADALSRMFIDEIQSDATVVVKDGKHINAHKCILAARSAYLAETIEKTSPQIISSRPESPDGLKQQKLKIDLTEFSYPAVYFSIMHIYSGIVKVSDDLDLEELTKLTHLLHVTTLRQVCMQNLRMNYCHFFHKPCNVCCLGVLKALPLAWRYDYTELYSKCLQWIGSHFANIFCLKEFSELKPHDLLEECYSATLSQLTPDNIIPKTIECQKLLKNLPRVKWTESIICLVGRLLEDFCHYVADNYEKILQSESFLNLGKNCWECEILEENLLAAMNQLKPDSGCKTLIQLHKIECSIESYCEDPKNVSDSFANLVSKMRKYCERYLLKEAAAVVHCSSWKHMNPALQKRIKDQAIIATDFDEPTKQLASKPKLPSMSRVLGNQQQQSNSPLSQQSFENNSSGGDGTRSPSNRSTPDSRLRSPSTTYLPAPKSKTASARHVKVLK